MSQIESGRPDGSRVSGIDSPLAKAESAVRLFAELAEQRPEVMNRLLGLLEVLVDAPAARDGAQPHAAEPSEPPAPLPLRLAEQIEIEESLVEHVPDPPNPPAAPATEAPPARIVEPKPAREKPRGAVDAKAEVGLAQLLSRHGSLSSGVGGLGKSGAAPLNAPETGRWDSDAAAAGKLARLFRSQRRRMRAIRSSRHESRPLPPPDGVLAHERIDDWSTQTKLIDRLSSHALKEAERWYAAAAVAMQAVSDWLSDHPSEELGRGLTPEPLEDRLRCAAIAQKGVFSWMEQHFARGARCEVQSLAFMQIRAWVREDCFAVFLKHGLQLRERITAEERESVIRKLEQFELEQVPSAMDQIAAQVRTEPVRPPTGSTHRFETVEDAFEAARLDFGGELLVFTDDALQSAEDSAFKRPWEVYDFLQTLHGIARVRSTDARDGIRIESDFEEAGYRMKPCSKRTMERHHRHYHICFEGQSICISQHVTLGSKSQNTCISIHWWHDEENRRFVIGHCGKHLPNTLT